MALTDLYSNIQMLLRWIHLLAAVIWIGHLYFFNFVNVPFQGAIAPDIKKTVNPELLRASAACSLCLVVFAGSAQRTRRLIK